MTGTQVFRLFCREYGYMPMYRAIRKYSITYLSKCNKDTDKWLDSFIKLKCTSLKRFLYVISMTKDCTVSTRIVMSNIRTDFLSFLNEYVGKTAERVVIPDMYRTDIRYFIEGKNRRCYHSTTYRCKYNG